MRKKRSFFEKLSGAVRVETHEGDFDDEVNIPEEPEMEIENREEEFIEEDDGQLSVDVLNTPEEIIIRAMVAGVKPQDLDIQISRDMITIHGTREESEEVEKDDYYHRELYWGSFSRNILLPEEIDVELAEAKEKHGLLEIHLPKLDKNRKAKLSVKSS